MKKKKLQKGGVINDNRGQYVYPGRVTKINSNRITMKGLKDPLLGISDTGDVKMMYPNNEYLFDGSEVIEYPIMKNKNKKTKKAQEGTTIDKYGRNTGLNWVSNPKVEANPYSQGDLDIISKYKAGDRFLVNREDIDNFNTGRLSSDHQLMNILPGYRKQILQAFKDSEELSSLEAGHIDLRKIPQTIEGGREFGQLGNDEVFRIFSSGFSKEPKRLEPLIDEQLKMITSEKKVIPSKKQTPTKAEYYNIDGKTEVRQKTINPKLLDKGYIPTGKHGKRIKAQSGLNNINPFNQSPIQTNWGSENLFVPNQFTALGQAQQFNNTLPNLGENVGKAGNMLNSALPVATDLLQGFQMLKEQGNQKKEAKQFKKLSQVVRQASELEPDRVERKYVRPEDQIIDPNTLASSYGKGTNFLAKDGTKLLLGDTLSPLMGGNQGNIGGMLGSFIGGGKGAPGGASKIGSTVGGIAGSVIPGVGTVVGSLAGGLVGGIIDGVGQKKIKRDQDAALHNLQMGAFNQGTKAMHNQYSAFMKEGGTLMEGNGELETLWGGKAEPISYNPYLPDTGESIMFKGDSHNKGGIGINYGKNRVEVEGGEPAVKLQDGGTQKSLTVFGNMKIPSYGVSELNDPKAKGKKFKNYITELSKIEDKQNKILEKGTELIENSDMNDPYEKLTFSSGKAMVEGGNMKLKKIAEKKQIASDIQNAILDTADEFNLDSDALSKGKVKKSKKLNIAQLGTKVKDEETFSTAPLSERERLLSEGFNPVSKSLYLKNTLGKLSKEGSERFNKEFAEARKAGLKEFIYTGDNKPYTTELATGNKNDYVELLYDLNQRTPSTKALTDINVKIPFNTPSTRPSSVQSEQQTNNETQAEREKFDWMSGANSLIPFLRPSNQRGIDPNQLSGEMFALSTNQLEPVQAQLYEPLLEQVSDISLQDQLNANQADFNAIRRLTANNPAAQAILAGQKYQANSKVLADQFRLNQAQKMGTYNKNREILNDATLKNLQILDQQYVRQTGAKAKTKATAQAALNSIADKIAKNKLENRTLGIYENLYNYRFGPNGYAWNMNPLAQFNTQGSNLPVVDSQGKEITEVDTISTRRDRLGMPIGTTTRQTQIKKPKKKGNGGIVKSMKNY